jgi:phosphoglycolate phosphatase
MKYRLLLWDFDGTLADTLELALRTFNKLAERFGFRPVENALAARHLTTLDFLKKHKIPLTKLPSVLKEFRLAQRGQMEAVRLFPGLLAHFAHHAT